MSEIGLVQIIEGALLAAGKAMTVAQLAELFEEQERPQNTDIREALKVVADRCEDRGFELQEVASGFRFQVRQSLSPWVARLWQERPQKTVRQHRQGAAAAAACSIGKWRAAAGRQQAGSSGMQHAAAVQ